MHLSESKVVPALNQAPAHEDAWRHRRIAQPIFTSVLLAGERSALHPGC
jgi:hypothetical protein